MLVSDGLPHLSHWVECVSHWKVPSQSLYSNYWENYCPWCRNAWMPCYLRCMAEFNYLEGHQILCAAQLDMEEFFGGIVVIFFRTLAALRFMIWCCNLLSCSTANRKWAASDWYWESVKSGLSSGQGLQSMSMWNIRMEKGHRFQSCWRQNGLWLQVLHYALIQVVSKNLTEGSEGQSDT